jgi:site-specific recombinase XerD
MPGIFQLLDTLRNKLDCTLWHLRQQLRPSLRTSEIRLRRTVRTDFLLRVPAAGAIHPALVAFHALFGRIGERAKMPFPVHPHMLRHGCGYALANAGHDTRALQAWLGHKNIQHTVRYTELAPDRFKNFWRE